MIPEKDREKWSSTEDSGTTFDLDSIPQTDHRWEPEPNGMKCVSPGHHHGVILKPNQEAYKDARGEIQIRTRIS